ncbi:heat shock protein Hsp20 [Methanothermus fervidus DSM 2088]|uniref:Heat shock protein Hsp20 n=1 Tax=Methanothermus fervidus (strain ATCC 43054 / DSM 2088 / JCM 10308 / V24 S) TaxID=523846 RepID=E3GX56_METFV|nr:Hsp20/alpha crystallin family protein [Methanothermus fervidus]ADP78051.1 heat shock protein Hsp20 [Methanothermus fervidus DSM 2088]
MKDWKEKFGKPEEFFRRRGFMIDKMMEDMINTMKKMHEEFERRLSEYTEFLPAKPSVDVIDAEDKIIVKTDLPGVKKEDLDVKVSEDTVTISANVREELEVEKGNYFKKERRYGEAHREVKLPAKVKPKEAKAKFENGVLTIEIPKKEVKEKVSVKIE